MGAGLSRQQGGLTTGAGRPSSVDVLTMARVATAVQVTLLVVVQVRYFNSELCLASYVVLAESRSSVVQTEVCVTVCMVFGATAPCCVSALTLLHRYLYAFNSIVKY